MAAEVERRVGQAVHAADEVIARRCSFAPEVSDLHLGWLALVPGALRVVAEFRYPDQRGVRVALGQTTPVGTRTVISVVIPPAAVLQPLPQCHPREPVGRRVGGV